MARLNQVYAAVTASLFVLFPATGALIAQDLHATVTASGTDELARYLDAREATVSATDDGANDDNCLGCHGDAGLLIEMVRSPEAPPEDGCATAPSRPAFLGFFEAHACRVSVISGSSMFCNQTTISGPKRPLYKGLLVPVSRRCL